jgi:uncharacterized protein
MNAAEVLYSKEARVKLIPRDAWWTALFLDAPQRLDTFCDARAAASAAWLQTALRTGAEPFNSHFRSWLAEVS